MVRRLEFYWYPIVGLLVLGLLVFGLGDTIGELALAFFLTYLLFPVVKKLESKGYNRSLVTLAIMFLSSAISVTVIILIIPPLYKDLTAFISEVPNKFSTLLDLLERLQNWLREIGFIVDLPLSREEMLAFIAEQTQKVPSTVVGQATGVVKSSVTNVVRFVLTLLDLFLIPLFFFYILTAYERLRNEFTQFIPPRLQPKAKEFFRRANNVLSGYIRGQIIVCLTLSGLYGFGLMLTGLRFGILIGVLAGFGNLIPYFGFAIGITTAVLVALVNAASTGQLIAVISVFLIVQIFESYILTPKIVGDKVGLNPLVTILALIVGGNMGGLMGMLVAIPLAGIFKIIYEDFKVKYKSSEFYRATSTS